MLDERYTYCPTGKVRILDDATVYTKDYHWRRRQTPATQTPHGRGAFAYDQPCRADRDARERSSSTAALTTSSCPRRGGEAPIK
jgi:hypothetical protein